MPSACRAGVELVSPRRLFGALPAPEDRQDSCAGEKPLQEAGHYAPALDGPAFDIRAARRDLYRPAVLRWMMPLVAILSTMETVSLSASLAPDRSFASSEARIALSALRSFERICRLCSRRLTFCRFALRADLVRLATDPRYREKTIIPGRRGGAALRWRFHVGGTRPTPAVIEVEGRRARHARRRRGRVSRRVRRSRGTPGHLRARRRRTCSRGRRPWRSPRTSFHRTRSPADRQATSAPRPARRWA